MNQKLLISFRIIISVTFILSAISKIISPGYFEITLIDQGLFPDREIASYFARIFIAFELAIGLLFLQKNYLRKIISPVTLFLLTIFIGHMLILILLGDNENCGCFSSMISMSPLEAIIKNIVLVILTYFVFKHSDRNQNKKVLPSTLIVLSILIVFLMVPIKSSNEFPFSKFTNFENVGRVDLAENENIVAVFEASCEHCIETAKTLKRINTELEEFPNVYQLIFTETDEEIKKFNAITTTDFPYNKINVDDFFNLIDTAPPRIYWIKDGEIIKIIDNNIDQELWNTFNIDSNAILEFNIE
ncbi:MAG: MauE/DoxX family redox-associated membrane protein [Bacteroidota bacterium]